MHLLSNSVYDAIKKYESNICVSLLDAAITIFYYIKFPDVKGVTMLKYRICKTDKRQG